MKPAVIYSLKVWLTAILLAPIPALYLQNNKGWTPAHYATEYGLDLVGQLILFSPLIIIHFLFTAWLNKKNWTIWNKRLVILLQAELLFLIGNAIFSYFTNTFRLDLYRLEILSIYGIIIGFGILFYTLKPSDNKLPDLVSDKI